MRRWLLKLVLFLVFGAIVNVAVAWACAAYVNIDVSDSPQVFRLSTTDWEVSRGTAFGSEAIGYIAFIARGDRAISPQVPNIPRWSGLPNRPDRMDPMLMPWASDARGWPMYSMSTRYYRGASPQSASIITDGLFVRPSLLGVSGRRVLPLRPIWPGFAINTVFYAVVLWLLFAGPFVVRRRRRIRRGLCPKCAYDLRNRPTDSTTCPECGATVAPASKALQS